MASRTAIPQVVLAVLFYVIVIPAMAALRKRIGSLAKK